MGDTVNLAARLESHTKQAGHPVLIDAATREQLGAAVKVTALAPAQLPGKSSPVEIFALD